MFINRFKLVLLTALGDFGFECEFHAGLNIIRGDNSSGKSTLVQSLFYALGMEELLGGKGENTLPYALRDYLFEKGDDKYKLDIVESSVLVEVKNKRGDVKTFKRYITSEQKSSKLLQVIHGPYLSNTADNYKITDTYLHDAGSAIHTETGFFKYLEDFLALNLPDVVSSKGGNVKLYVQTIFSAMFVEQKRGWTDYIANTPYYAISSVKKKIVEYLLAFDTFENEKNKNEIQDSINKINSKWGEIRYQIKLLSEQNSLLVRGLSERAVSDFDEKLVEVNYFNHGVIIPVSDKIVELNNKREALNNINKGTPENLVSKFEEYQVELDKLVSLSDMVFLDIQMHKSSIRDYEETKKLVDDDLKKNKIAQKLRTLGAEQNIKISKDICPACHNPIDDSLVLADATIQPMNIDENIKYLESQKRMLEKCLMLTKEALESKEAEYKQIKDELIKSRAKIVASRRDLRSLADISEAELRVKIQTEDEIKYIVNAKKSIDELLVSIKSISDDFKVKSSLLAGLPTDSLSNYDISKIKKLTTVFKQLVSKFGYRSARIDDIEINFQTLYPYLSGIELREIKKRETVDLKTDSSASDFVRLIWAYLIAVYKVSSSTSGNHPGLIIFDEPAQHSMGVGSVNEMLKELASDMRLQSIVAASFDEKDSVFEESTKDVSFHLIRIGDKLLQRIG